MWFEFRITVEGELEAKDEAEARMILRATVGRLGSLDVEELRAIEDEDEDPDSER
jgi:hypothetical protein